MRRVIELYSMALNDNVEGNAPDLELDKLYEVYDSLSHQEIVVAEDSGEVVGVMSYDLKRKVPFFEGVAVDPEYRQMGVASKLTRNALELARSQGLHEIHFRSQPSSTEANKRQLGGLGLNYTVDNSGRYPLFVVKL